MASNSATTTTTARKVSRVKYPTVSLRMTPSTKDTVETLSARFGCTYTALVIYALDHLDRISKDKVSQETIAEIEQFIKTKKKVESDARRARNRERKEKGIALKLGRPPRTRRAKKK